MSEADKHESQEEGFFTQKIQIKQTTNHQGSTSTHTKSHFYKASPFEAKCLPWTGSMRKQPPQALVVALEPVSAIPERAEKKKNRNIAQDHPYKLYASNQSYQLVYSRSRTDPIVNSKFFMGNQVKLEHVGSKNVVPFKKLREFDRAEHAQKKGDALTFDSRFECGNLYCAFKHEKSQEYILFIQNDTNSLGYNQWFYFSVLNHEPNLKYTFKIVNFKKKHSFFKYGSKPAVFSLQEAKQKGSGWSRKGKNITYEITRLQILLSYI